jgi:uncharacterized protein (DUF1330 family)
VKVTPTEHADYEHLVNSFSVISQLYEFLQENIEQAENQASLFKVQRRVDVTDHEVSDHFELHLKSNKVLQIFGGNRQFIREGAVTVLEGKNRKKRYLFLFSDLALVTKQHGKQNFRYKKTVPLDDEDIALEPLADSSCILQNN